MQAGIRALNVFVCDYAQYYNQHFGRVRDLQCTMFQEGMCPPP